MPGVSEEDAVDLDYMERTSVDAARLMTSDCLWQIRRRTVELLFLASQMADVQLTDQEVERALSALNVRVENPL